MKFIKIIVLTLLTLSLHLGCSPLEEESEDDNFNGFFHAISFSGGLGDFSPITNTDPWMIEFNIGTDPVTSNPLYVGRIEIQNTYHAISGITGADIEDPTMTCDGTTITLNSSSAVFTSLHIGQNLENESDLESGDPYYTFYVVMVNGLNSALAHVCVTNGQTSDSTYTLVDSIKIR